MRCLVTGASGFVGSHFAEKLIAEGWTVRTVVRPSSRTELLKSWGVELVEGDLTDPATLSRAVDGVDAIVHAAAMVGDWGPHAEYHRVNVVGLQQMFDACRGRPLRRFVLISSLGVYPARDHHGTDESCELPQRHIDGYTQSKADADRVALKERRDHGTPLVVLRPGFVYGPRDRTVLPRILMNLKRGMVTYFGGSRRKRINQIYVGNIADACLLALTVDRAVGQVFNITDAECVAKEDFFNTIADLAGLPRPKKTMPMWLAKGLCSVMGVGGKLFGVEPILTGAKIKFMGYDLDYSIAKARKELGYEPKTAFPEGIRAAMEWWKSESRGG